MTPITRLAKSLILVLGLASLNFCIAEDAPPRASFPAAHEMEEDTIQWTKTGKLRRVQADEFFPNDDPYWNPNGVMERKPCIPFEQIRQAQINSPNADGNCATNTCNGGCCRAYNWLLCDDDSSFAYVSCVCNDNTWPPEQWTKAPTVPRPTAAPTPAPPTTAAPTPPPTTAPLTGAPTQAPILNAATEAPVSTETDPLPDLCPMRVRTTCATKADGTPCTEVGVPEDPTSPDCNVTVVYTYNMTNLSPSLTRQVFSLSVLRNNELLIVTNFRGEVPFVFLEPGESHFADGFDLTYDVCSPKGIDVFDAKVEISGGPPVTSVDTATCATPDGQDCSELVQDPNAADCLLNVTHTYTVENVATIPYNIVVFNVTRAGERRKLIDILQFPPDGGDDTEVVVGGSVSITEQQEVNVCEPLPSFETEVTTRKAPPLGELCTDIYYYPYGEIPDLYRD